MNKKLIKGIFVFIVFGLILWAAVIIYFKFYYIDIYQDQNIDVFRIKLSNDDLDFFQDFRLRSNITSAIQLLKKFGYCPDTTAAQVRLRYYYYNQW